MNKGDQDHMNEHAGHRGRLRETFLRQGIDGMHDHQVLEMLLTYALPRVDVNPMAHRLLSRFGSLEGVLNARVQELQQVEGIGPSAAAFLSLLGQVARRMLLQRFSEERGKAPVLDTPAALCGYMLALSIQDRYETLRLVCLNKHYGLVYEGIISSGSLTEVLADPRPILEEALAHKACYIALAHNHPSGNVTPSHADRMAVLQIEAAAENLGIGVVDQLVLGYRAVYSFHKDRVLIFAGSKIVEDMTLAEYESIHTHSSAQGS